MNTKRQSLPQLNDISDDQNNKSISKEQKPPQGQQKPQSQKIIKNQNCLLQDRESLVKFNSQAQILFRQLEQEFDQKGFSKIKVERIHSQQNVNDSPFKKLNQQYKESHINQSLSQTDNYINNLDALQSGQENNAIQNTKKMNTVPDFVNEQLQNSNILSTINQGSNSTFIRSTLNYQHQLSKQQKPNITEEYKHKKNYQSIQNKLQQHQFLPSGTHKILQQNQQIKPPISKTINQSRISLTLPQNQKQQLLFQDEMDLKKQFIFALILTFIFLHLYYAMVYQLQYFTIVNLFMIMLWITISPHHQNIPTIKSQSKEFQNVLFNFIKSKFYHKTVNQPIFKIIFINFVLFDISFFKLFITKLGFMSGIIQSIPSLKSFMDSLINIKFINLIEKIFNQSWNVVITGLNKPQSTETNPNQFFMITIFKYVSKVFYWVFIVFSGLWNFISEFFIQIILDGKYFIYLILIILCALLAFKNFFQVSKRIQKIIDNATSSNLQKEKKQQKTVSQTQKGIKQEPRAKFMKLQMKDSGQKSDGQQSSAKKKIRFSVIRSSLSQNQQKIKSPYDDLEQSQVYTQISKYLLICSLFFMYSFCFLASDSYNLMFASIIPIKQMWSLVVCLYAFLIVQYCKRNQKFIHKDISDEFKFKIKCYIVKIMVIILIMHDFLVLKEKCQTIQNQSNIVTSFQCFSVETKYFYYFKEIFFNSHTDSNIPQQDQFKLNIFLDIGMKMVILINLRLNKFYLFKNKRLFPTSQEISKGIDDRQSSVQNFNLGQSIYSNNTIGGASTQSYKLKKKITNLQKNLQRNTIVLLILTILAMTLTNSLSNIVILFGVFINIPSYNDRNFRIFLMIGVTLGLILQPNQFIYFTLSLIVVYIRGKNKEFTQHSHWVVIQFSRLYILFSKVSVINFLMGLMPSAVLVMYCLSFRIIFNYFGWISVFMGTQDNYSKSYFYNFIPHSIFVDAALWMFMILFKTYTPNLLNTFQKCEITNIFKEYPILQKIQPVLKILKIIQLIAYITTELIVFTQTPSIIVFIRLFMHLIIAAVDLAYEKANQTLKNLWKVNLYVSLFIAFLKYFYLLNRYENLSNWLLALLEPLQQNWSIIGLWSAEGTQNIFVLMLMFLPDICIIILSILVEYTLQVKIFQAYRQMFVQNNPPKLQNEDSNSQQNNHTYTIQAPCHIESMQNKKQNQISIYIFPESTKPNDSKDIQYLYKNYIKDLKFNFFKHTSTLSKILSDFLYDIYFLLFCIIYMVFENKDSFSGFWLNMPHFLIAFIIFMRQEDRRLPQKTFNYSIIYCCITILLLYLKYLYSYVTYGHQDTQKISFFKLSDIVNKYLFFLLGCLFYKIHEALKYHLDTVKQQKSKDRRKNLIYIFIMPLFERGFTITYIKEITILWASFFKAGILAVFIANFFTSTENLIFNILMVGYLLLVIQFPHILGYHSQQDSLMHYWVNPFLISFCFTIWCQNMIGYAGLIFFRIYIIFYMEFQLAVNFLNCEYVSESQKNLIQRIDDRFNRKSIDKLSIIAQQKQGISKMNFSSEDDQSNKQWQFRNLYKTTLLILPHFCLLLMFSSQLLIFKNYFSAIMGIVILSIFFYSVKFIQRKQVFRSRMKRIIKIYFGLFFTVNAVISEHIIYDLGQNTNIHLRLGFFFLCLGFFYFMYLVEDTDKQNQHMYLISRNLRIVFLQARCEEALQYWSIKSEFVSQLGSQIHNQKKLLKLQKFYITKQKISRRVEKLIEDIQQRGKNNFRKNYHSAGDFQIIDQIIDYKQQGNQYELFSNMLLTLSLQDLQYCLEMMNHYYGPCIERKNKISRLSKINNENMGDINQIMPVQMKQIRTNVLHIYHGSIFLAFKQYKHSLKNQIRQKTHCIHGQQRESQLRRKSPLSPIHHSQMKNQDQFSSYSEQDELVNLEKSELMNQKYVRCMQRIHHKSMQIPWIWRKIIQNSQIISLVIVAGWNFFGGVYAIPANFAIFAWALVLQTKTTVFLWSYFIIYSGFIIIFKLILPQLPSFPVFNFIFYYYSATYYYEFIIILVSSLQIFLIKLGGTEYKSYSERQSIYDAFYRKSLNKAAHKIQSQLEPQFIETYKTLSQPSRHSFFYRVFSKSRLKPGKDFYPLMSGIQLLILMYIFFFYDMMEFESRNNRKSLGQILTVNQFSKNMMIVLFTQVIIMVLDRCIASLNLIDVKNQALQNFLLNFAFSDHIKYRAPDDITHVGFFDFLLILKYLFHIFLMLVVNFFVYFYIPSSGFQKSLIPQCQNATCGKSYTFLSIFLLLYLAYFVVSGLQIKHGFSRDKCRNKLMQKFHWTNYYVYVLFTGIPFLWEFKKICDWTITTTALPLFHWMKFQDINARLYQSKCEAQMLKIKPRAKTPLTKYILGPIGCVFILGVVFSPLILYSSLNPFAVKDQVLAAEVKLNLLVNGSVEYKFFSTSHSVITQNLSIFSESYRDQFETSNTIKSSIDFQDNNDFYLKMSSYPDQNFKISEPAIQKLSARIQRATNGGKYRFFDIVLHAKIIQKQGGQNEIEWARKRLSNVQLTEFKQFILSSNSTLNNTDGSVIKSKSKYFKLTNFYSPIPGTIQNKTICLITTNNGQYYELYTPDRLTNQCKQIEKKQQDQNPGILLFYSSSTKYKISFGLLTFYLTYVLLISKLFRLYLTGNLDNVIYQGCNLQRMLILCDAVRQARILQNLYQQEYLYSFLVDIMRNPRTLKQMSGSFTQLRKQLPLN